MKKRFLVYRHVGYWVVVLLLFSACKGHTETEYHSLHEKILQESAPFPDSVLTSEIFLTDMERVEVLDSIHRFMIPERKHSLLSYPCSSCHSQPLQQMKGGEMGKRAHWNIRLQHASKKTMNCVTCHNPEDMNALQSLTGQNIDMNHSYQLCSQCHSSQFTDWKGGAHGKQLGGWAPPRTSMTCVQCHNPHAPALGSRWPARYNSTMASERE